MGGLVDPCGRHINYLRVSVTDRCNLRCVYCLPQDGVPLKEHRDMLTFEELAEIVGVAVELGIDRVRLTGGEPLVRRGIVDLCRRVKEQGVSDLSLTTNAVLLERLAGKLKAAGLDRVNISLDSLRPERYRQITRCDSFSQAWNGLMAAVEAGLDPVKVNVVVIRGFNDDEIEDLAGLALRYPVSVRFIELMPIGTAIPWSRRCRVGGDEVLARLTAWSGGKLEPTDGRGNGPATTYRLQGSPGTIGLIAPVSDHICSRCNRLRLTSDGRLIPCLGGGDEFSLRDVLRAGQGRSGLEAAFRAAVAAKRPEGGFADAGESCRMMSRTGG